MADTFILDPVEVAAAGRSELDINALPLRVKVDGIDWGDAAIEAFMAEGRVGSVAVDYRIPNRIITIPMLAKGTPTTVATALASLQNKVAQIQRRGGQFKRGRTAGDLFVDVVNATLSVPDTGLIPNDGLADNITLTLESVPDFYAAEETIDLGASSGGELVATDLAIAGDYPARVRIELTETANKKQRGLLFAFRETPDVAAPMNHPASDFTTEATNLSQDLWLPTLDLGTLTHVGPHRVWVKVKGGAYLRLEWGPGGSVNQILNPITPFASVDGYVWVDLGEIDPPLALVGDQAWTGRILGKLLPYGSLTAIDAQFLRVLILPSRDCYGYVTVTDSSPTQTPDLYDDFSGLASLASLAGTPLVGGGVNWGSITGSATGDFLGRGTTGVARATNDGGVATGRWDRAGNVDYSDCSVQATVNISGFDATRTGVFAHLVDDANWFMAAIHLPGGRPNAKIAVYKCVSGVETAVAGASVSVPDQFRSIQLAIDSDGNWSVTQWSPFGSQPSTADMSGNDADLAAGGALDAGKLGIYDGGTSTATTRELYGFVAYTSLTTEAVLMADSDAELRTSGYVRANGSSFSSLPIIGDNPRIPPGESVDVFLRSTNGRLDQFTEAEAPVPSITATLNYSPSTLFVPS